MMQIEYFSSPGLPIPRFKRRLVKEWICRVAASRGYDVGDLCYQFCTDEEILDYNRRFLGHDYYTDIITFDETADTTIGGSMLISLETVSSNAVAYGVSFREELMRVIIHGVLHLTGQGDKTDKEAMDMRELERVALSLWRDLNDASLAKPPTVNAVE